MGTKVKFMPLCGVHSEAPLCYLLQLDDFTFLLDCGWNDSFDTNLLKPLQSVVKDIDAVLISHPDTAHLGALPYAYGKLDLKAPVYCTRPVHKLGILYMYDHVLARLAVSKFNTFTLDDIDGVFEKSIVDLKYSQHLQLTGKGEGITITAYAAGHLLGGTVWKITKDTEDIIYAVDYHHRKERHLSGTVLETFVRPAVLITDAYNALSNQAFKKERDHLFIDSIMSTLRGNGSVLIPVETAGRVLELILYLEQHWATERLAYPLVFLTHVSYHTIDTAKSSLEWMSDTISKTFDTSRDNAFEVKYINLKHSREEFDSMLTKGPQVVLASTASLEAGFARDLFVEWAGDPKNLVLFTERGPAGTLARVLQAEPAPKAVKVVMSKKVRLEGEELQAYEEEQRKLKGLDAAGTSPATDTVMENAGEDGPERTDGGTQSAEAAEGQVLDQGLRAPPNVNGGVNRLRETFCDGFTPPAKAVAPMFPDDRVMTDWDEYGEVINPDDYKAPEADHMEVGSPSAANKDANGGQGVDEGQEEMLDEGPTKVVMEEITVQVKSKLQYVDFEGRSDGRSMKTILAHVAPLKMILVHGSAEATEHLRQYCIRNICPHVHAPRIGEWVEVSSDTNVFKVRLTEKLMTEVIFKKLGDYEVAWVDGVVGKPEEDDVLPLWPCNDGTVEDEPAPQKAHKAIFIGEVRLADFKQLLTAKGVQVRASKDRTT
ncbi:hypothetical protein CBR_g4749 [Chara braunii]|uniref:Cleavage and polyadenylation specificity factor subunit 2 n=1 Tax=Chara braunii TaxID=69332 RepID=A0A388KIP2_CHABU|nr:hypothetical protein CBR_g4749 [Chara braunii]|eukprot:GBG69921.1 hypothetical protein CBR_g4749 [Chara braunii]